MSRPFRIAIGLGFIVSGLAIIYLELTTGGLVRAVGVVPLLIVAAFSSWAAKAAKEAAFPKRDERAD